MKQSQTFRPGAWLWLSAWCLRAVIGGPADAAPPPPPRWPVVPPGLGGMGPGRRLAPPPFLRGPGWRRGSLSAPRAPRRAGSAGPCGGRRRLVRAPRFAFPPWWSLRPSGLGGSPLGAWFGGRPGLVPGACSAPPGGWGPWPRRVAPLRAAGVTRAASGGVPAPPASAGQEHRPLHK